MSPFYEQFSRTNKGAWIIHHSQKTAGTVNGAAEFPALDAAGKAAALLSQMAATSLAMIPNTKAVRKRPEGECYGIPPTRKVWCREWADDAVEPSELLELRPRLRE